MSSLKETLKSTKTNKSDEDDIETGVIISPLVSLAPL